MNTAKRNIFGCVAIVFIFMLVSMFSGCGYVSAAWVAFKADGGYIEYTNYMGPTANNHINYYESLEAKAQPYSSPMLTITFYPRILGPTEERDATIVDMSQRYHDMTVVVYKSSSIYDPNKSVYLNGVKLVCDPSYYNDLSNLVSYTFTDVDFVIGNPGGKINGFVNEIEYKI